MSQSLSIGRSLLLNMLVAIGIAVVWLVIGLWIVSRAGSILRSNRYEVLYVRLDGEPLLYRYTTSGTRYERMQTFTLDGQPAEMDDQQFLYAEAIRPGLTRLANPLVAQGWYQRLAAVNDGRTPANYWYLVHDGRINGRSYGVGYHSLTKEAIGYFGKKGVSDRVPPRDEWFSIAGSSGLALATPMISTSEPLSLPQPRLVFLSEGKLWAFHTQDRTVEAVLDAPQATSLGHIWRLLDKLPEKQPGVMAVPAQYLAIQKLLLRSEDTCTVIDPQSDNRSTFSIPSVLRRAPFQAYELASGELLLISEAGTVEKLGHRVVWLAADGSIEREKTVQIAQLAMNTSSNVSAAWGAVVSAPLPLAFVLLTIVEPLNQIERGAAESYAAAAGQLLRDAWPAILIVVAMSAVLAVLAYRRQRRFGLSHAAAWAVFTFVLGVPGWIAYRFHRSWPVLEECPACHQAAPRDREACLDCGAVFPPPPAKGIEVFA